mmetsp:Transcript_83408/g.179912  ORF Transcript_83408/g.179912 Transcript_83408/m.179912 type:complete len:218 (-) Transcript_83408:931-1584(-)
MHIMGKPILKKSRNETWCPASCAMPAMMTLLEAPMSVPMPPRSAPKARDHARGLSWRPSTLAVMRLITGIIVVVNGMLSTNAETTADTRCRMMFAASWRCATGTMLMTLLITSAISRSRPSSASPSVKTKRPAKKRSESHSTLSRACSRSWWSTCRSSSTAPKHAVYAGSRCVTGWRKNIRMQTPSTLPAWRSSFESLMGYICLSFSASAWMGLLKY